MVEKNLTAILTGDQSHLQLPVSPPVEEATGEPAQEEKQEPEEEEGRMQVQEQELEPIPAQQQKSEVAEANLAPEQAQEASESKQPAGSAEESVLNQEQELVDAQRQEEHGQPSQLQQHEPMDVGIPAEGGLSEPTQPVVGNVIKPETAASAASAEIHCAVAQPPSPDSNSQQKTVSETKRPIPNKSPTPTTTTTAAANPLLPPVRSQLLESSKTASTWLAQRLEQRSGGEDERRVHAHTLTHSVTNN